MFLILKTMKEKALGGNTCSDVNSRLVWHNIKGVLAIKCAPMHEHYDFIELVEI